MPPGTELTQKFEEERVRTQEQSQIVHLQGQIDELRRLIKDQTNKYQWAMEQTRKIESSVAQVHTQFDHHTSNVAQIVDRSRRDVLDLRKEIASAIVKVQESVEPIRQMQAQIQQLAEVQKKDREEVAEWLSRIETTEQQYSALKSLIHDTEERHRQLALQLNHLRDADSEAMKEIRRVGEDIQVEKQSLRRQAVEAQQLVADVRHMIEEQEARITRIDEIRQNVELFAESIPGQIADINKKFPDIATELKRIERVSTERFLMGQERLEELRRQSDEKIVDLQHTEHQHTNEHTTWLERIDAMLIELDKRIVKGLTQLEDIQRYQKTLIVGLEEREIQTVSVLYETIQKQLEKLKGAQEELHRARESYQ